MGNALYGFGCWGTGFRSVYRFDQLPRRQVLAADPLWAAQNWCHRPSIVACAGPKIYQRRPATYTTTKVPFRCGAT